MIVLGAAVSMWGESLTLSIMSTTDPSQRPLDLVVYGATGFTGGLVAEYLARKGELAPERWAIAGRNVEKLRAVKENLVAIDPKLEALVVLEASSDAPETLREMTGKTRAVLSLVGPYAIYGEPLVAACVDTKTDYCDLTGEPSWWKEMIARYHDAAVESGTLLVSCCGFDSIPYDLGVLYTTRYLPSGCEAEISGYMASKAQFSGGTWASAIHAMANARADQKKLSKARSERSSSSESEPRAERPSKPRGLHRSKEVDRWVVPLPTIDPLVVRRSQRLGATRESGVKVRYNHYLQLKSLTQGLMLGLGIAGVFGMSQLSWMRGMLQRYKPSGDGPTREVRSKSWFRVIFVAEGGGRRAVTEVRGGDPGYDETSKMISECGLCLTSSRSSLPSQGGFSTPAAAFGDVLIDRLEREGISFRLLEGHGGAAES